MSARIGLPTRRLVLGAAAALLPFARARAAAPLGLLAPAAYDDPGFLTALKGNGPAWSVSALAHDDDAAGDLAGSGARPALVVAAHPWAPGLLWPEGGIIPLPDGTPGPTPGRLGALFPPNAVLEQSLDGRDRLGLATRFDLAAPLIRTDRVPRDTLDEVGLGILDDPALDGRIALFDDGRCLLASLMLYAELDPFRLLLPSERDRFAAVIQTLVQRVALVSSDPRAILDALAAGTVDLALPMGLRHQALARAAGLGKIALAVPRSGPLAGRGAFGWIELASIVGQDATAKAAAAALGRLALPTTRLALARADASLQPVVGLEELRAELSAAETAALSLEEWPALTGLITPMGLMPERKALRAALDQALAHRAKG